MAGIVYANYYLPDTFYPVWDFLKTSKFKHARDEDFCECFISQSKQEFIHVEQEKNEVQIFDGLLRKFFEECPIPRDEITHVIFTSLDNWVRDGVYIPFYLVENYSLTAASITGLSQECVTSLQALQFAHALVESNTARNVLILSICYGRTMEERYTGTTVVGDGAGVMLVGKNGNHSKIVGFDSVADGRYSFYKYNRLPPKIGGLEIAKKGVEFIIQLLKKNGRTLDEMKMIIPQNINFSEYHMYAQYLGIGMERFFTRNIVRGGHLTEVDTIRNYVDFRNDPDICAPGFVLLFGSGTIGDGMDAVYNGVILEIE